MTLFWYLFFLLALNTVHTSIVVAFVATVLLGKFSKDVLTGFTQGITMGYLVLPGFDSWRMSRTYVRLLLLAYAWFWVWNVRNVETYAHFFLMTFKIFLILIILHCLKTWCYILFATFLLVLRRDRFFTVFSFKETFFQFFIQTI